MQVACDVNGVWNGRHPRRGINVKSASAPIPSTSILQWESHQWERRGNSNFHRSLSPTPSRHSIVISFNRQSALGETICYPGESLGRPKKEILFFPLFAGQVGLLGGRLAVAAPLLQHFHPPKNLHREGVAITRCALRFSKHRYVNIASAVSMRRGVGVGSSTTHFPSIPFT